MGSSSGQAEKYLKAKKLIQFTFASSMGRQGFAAGTASVNAVP